MVTLCAIFQPTGRSDGPAVMDLTVSNLHLNAQRITNFCRMIRLSSLIKPISQIIGFRRTPEFETIERYVFGTIYLARSRFSYEYFFPETTKPLN